jgi:hypothetical protein
MCACVLGGIHCLCVCYDLANGLPPIVCQHANSGCCAEFYVAHQTRLCRTAFYVLKDRWAGALPGSRHNEAVAHCQVAQLREVLQ